MNLKKLENSRTPKTNSILKVYKLVLKSKSQKFSSQKIKFPGISPKSLQNKPSIIAYWDII